MNQQESGQADRSTVADALVVRFLAALVGAVAISAGLVLGLSGVAFNAILLKFSLKIHFRLMYWRCGRSIDGDVPPNPR
ncbi:MAG: hypothetical protein ABFC54_01660 [Thermoguttaceae bacterium]